MTITLAQSDTLSVDEKADNMERAMTEALIALGKIPNPENGKCHATSTGHYAIYKKTRIGVFLRNDPGKPQSVYGEFSDSVAQFFVAKAGDIFVAVSTSGVGGALTRPLRYDAVTHEIATRSFIDPRGFFAQNHYDEIMGGLAALTQSR